MSAASEASEDTAALRAQLRALEAANIALKRQLGRKVKRVATPRPWGNEKQPEASRGAPWWAVRRMGLDGSAHHGPMFRHASREAADKEAGFLAGEFPGAVFVVLEAVSVFVAGEAELRLSIDLDGPVLLPVVRVTANAPPVVADAPASAA